MECGKAFAKGINGLVDTVNWKKLGLMIGAGFMMVVNMLYGFVTTADWHKIGQALADCIMGLSESVDLPLLGTALGIGLQGVLNSLYTFVTGVDWGKIGS